MPADSNPAFTQFLNSFENEIVLGQVCLRRIEGDTFELRHQADAMAETSALRLLAVDELRALAQTTATGAFRPLKSAPNLQRGWRVRASGKEEFERALHHLYPGSIADWFAAGSPNPPVTNYREFTGRQSGMYRVTTLLSDRQAAQMIQACCHVDFCLKRRLWTVAGLDPDSTGRKSMIPCLEPCAVLLEFARKTIRIEQEDKIPEQLSSSEWETLRDLLELALADTSTPLSPSNHSREADFNVPSNPRRRRLLLEKIEKQLTTSHQAPAPVEE